MGRSSSCPWTRSSVFAPENAAQTLFDLSGSPSTKRASKRGAQHSKIQGRFICMTPKEVLKFAKEQKAVCVDLKFLDFLGTWQHFTIPTSELSEGLFDEGSGFDGSSIRGWQPINASDMLIVPDPTTAVMDPFTAAATLSL